MKPKPGRLFADIVADVTPFVATLASATGDQLDDNGTDPVAIVRYRDPIPLTSYGITPIVMTASIFVTSRR